MQEIFSSKRWKSEKPKRNQKSSLRIVLWPRPSWTRPSFTRTLSPKRHLIIMTKLDLQIFGHISPERAHFSSSPRWYIGRVSGRISPRHLRTVYIASQGSRQVCLFRVATHVRHGCNIEDGAAWCLCKQTLPPAAGERLLEHNTMVDWWQQVRHLESGPVHQSHPRAIFWYSHLCSIR